jgi:alkanesulfonate monooxygenase SsuD/methylene tetrahydromethanopterin reductase-like flavin-dependent oxidoreductase (luciferase family)
VSLKDLIPLGMSLPHRSPDPLAMTTISSVARRAEELGFADLWVTENTVDQGTCFDPVVILTHAAAITRRIGLGASVVVLPIHHPLMVAHQWAALDFASGGRAILATGLGRAHHYRDFQVPEAAKVRRFREQMELIKALWTQDKVTFHGQIYQVENVSLGVRPARKPRPPLWMGVGHPNAIRRAARIADGWMGSGGSSIAEFRASVPILKQELEKSGRDPVTLPISKRVFMAVDERPEVARAELNRWFTEVYHNPPGTDASGIHGTPAHVAERLADLVAAGASHLLLNPVSRHAEQLEAVAELAGLKQDPGHVAQP